MVGETGVVDGEMASVLDLVLLAWGSSLRLIVLKLISQVSFDWQIQSCHLAVGNIFVDVAVVDIVVDSSFLHLDYHNLFSKIFELIRIEKK